MKWNWMWGASPFIFTGILLSAFVIFMFTTFNNRSFNEWTTQRAELPRTIESFEAGDVTITDVRTGTEFTRIIRGPNGQMVVRSGWVNHWGEHQIRTRDDW